MCIYMYMYIYVVSCRLLILFVLVAVAVSYGLCVSFLVVVWFVCFFHEKNFGRYKATGLARETMCVLFVYLFVAAF